jgi:hypothetical protein
VTSCHNTLLTLSAPDRGDEVSRVYINLQISGNSFLKSASLVSVPLPEAMSRLAHNVG